MRMTKFRVQNYKNVDDTDWVNCDDITAFVGKNESGKCMHAMKYINM